MSSYPILLATAMVMIADVRGELHSFRALIDQGSEASFITESAWQVLRLPKVAVQAVITGIGASSGQSKHITTFTIKSQHDRNFEAKVEAFVMNKVTNLLPSSMVTPQRWDHLAALTLADP